MKKNSSGHSPSLLLMGMRRMLFARSMLLLVGLWTCTCFPSLAQKVYTVNSPGDQHDLDYNSSTEATHSNTTPCNVGGGNCTLRAAIEHSRSDNVPVLIKFNIPLSLGVPKARIQVINENYPAILSDVTIDGTTQPGYDTATKRPVIELDGHNAVRTDGVRVDGLLITGANTTVKGLHIHSFSGRRIKISPTGGSLSGVVITRNILGTDPDPLGIVDAGNGLGGVLIDGSFEANNNQVKENIISGNMGPGVQLNLNSFMFNTAAKNNLISKNSIFKNDGLGIQFSIDQSVGVTPNHDHPPMTPVTGPNNFSNYPELSAASIVSNKTHVEGTLRLSYRNAPFTIEFFANDACHVLHNGEGQMYLGSVDVQTDGNGDAPIIANLDKIAPNGSYITATSTDIDKNTSEFSRCFLLQAGTQSNADLRLNKTASASSVVVGDDLVFSIQVSNDGPDAATGIIIKDVLPAGLAFIQASSSVGTYDPGSALWTVGALANGGLATLNITVNAAQAGNYTNTANIQVADQADPNQPNNQSSAVISVLPPATADLRINKTASTGIATVGSNVSFDLLLTNDGPAPATGIVVKDVLPVNFTFVQAVASAGTYNAASGLWDVGSLGNGSIAKLTIVATAAQTGAVVNTANISASDQSDPNSANNQSSAGITIQPQQPVADLAITKFVDKQIIVVGQQCSFVITLVNLGPAAASNIIVSDKLPPGLNLVLATPSVGTYSASSGIWMIASLASGAKVSLTLLINGAEAGSFINKAGIISASEPDPNLNNNQSTASLTVQNVVNIQAQYTELINKVNTLVKSGKLSTLNGKILVFVLQQSNDFYRRGDKKNAVIALQAFKFLVNALVQFGQLSKDNAQPLIDAAQKLIETLQAPAIATAGNEARKEQSSIPGEPGVIRQSVKEVSLGNFPNPYYKSTTIWYGVPRNAWVVIEIFDGTGRMIARPVQQLMNAGVYTLNWQQSRLPAGLYLVRLQVAETVRTHRMVQVK